MKRTFLAVSVLMLTAALSASAQYSDPSKVQNSFHDLSAGTTFSSARVKATTFDEVCAFCHVPHQVKSTIDATLVGDPEGTYPLWNHGMTGTSYTPYTSSSMPVAVSSVNGNPGTSATVSALCLSCHDGTVGVNTLYSGQQSVPGDPGFVAGQYYTRYSPQMQVSISSVWTPQGTQGDNTPVTLSDPNLHGFLVGDSGSLANEHPVSFGYNAARALNPNLKAIAVQPSGLRRGLYTGAGSSGQFLPLYTYQGGGTDFMECGTCHNVHDQNTYRPFLRASMTGSQLCLACHGTLYVQ